MAQKRQENFMDIIGKGLTGYVKARAQQQKTMSDVKSKLLIKAIEQRMDPMYKI